MKIDTCFDSDYPLLVRVPVIKVVTSCEVEALRFEEDSPSTGFSIEVSYKKLFQGLIVARGIDRRLHQPQDIGLWRSSTMLACSLAITLRDYAQQVLPLSQPQIARF
jgi:hypothetical protein